MDVGDVDGQKIPSVLSPLVFHRNPSSYPIQLQLVQDFTTIHSYGSAQLDDWCPYSYWNGQFVDDLPIEFYRILMFNLMFKRSRRGRKLERYQNSIWFLDLLQIQHPRWPPCVELLEILLDLWRPRVPTGSRCTSLDSTRQEICQICPISGLNRWRPTARTNVWAERCKKIRALHEDLYRILCCRAMVFF